MSAPEERRSMNIGRSPVEADTWRAVRPPLEPPGASICAPASSNLETMARWHFAQAACRAVCP